MQADHSREIREMQQKHIMALNERYRIQKRRETSVLSRNCALWFPLAKEVLRGELVGLSASTKGRPQHSFVVNPNMPGELYSEEHDGKCDRKGRVPEVLKDPTDGTKVVLAPLTESLLPSGSEQFEMLRQNIQQPFQQQRKRGGIKL